MLTDIEIAQQATPRPIQQVAEELQISPQELIPYGYTKAKIEDSVYQRLASSPDGKLILVTAINPTPAGEGKTTTTIGLGMGLRALEKKSIIALREPSLGPVFGLKGGAAGGGYAQVIPMEDINLHFTGDIHAITTANNLLCAMIDNHLHQGNELQLDSERILLTRCMDMNDRALREVTVGLGGRFNGVPRDDHFQISVASEVMAILCLATSLEDLKQRLGRIMVGYTTKNQPVYARDLQAEGAMAALLKDALKPNLVQALDGTPALMHGGPFANIAHGCNSIAATRLGLKLADYTVTEAGFGSDLGAEKFFDIKAHYGNLSPSAVVLVATVRALKYNGGVARSALGEENLSALEEGLANLGAHIENMAKYKLPVVVALNRFATDTDEELAMVQAYCQTHGARYSLSECFSKGGDGALDLARQVIDACAEPNDFSPLYDYNASIEDKITTIAKEIYGADGVTFSASAERSIQEIAALGQSDLPVCIAKTQYSLSDNPKLLGRPQGFTIHVREISVKAGAGFIVALTGSIMTMPGLPKTPAATTITVTEGGDISGLF